MTTKSLHDMKPRTLVGLNTYLTETLDGHFTLIHDERNNRWDLRETARPDECLFSPVVKYDAKLRDFTKGEWRDAVMATIRENRPPALAKRATKEANKILDANEGSAKRAIENFEKKARKEGYMSAIKWGAESVIRAEFELELIKEARKEFEAGNWTDLLHWAHNAKRWMTESLLRGPDVGNGVSFYKFAEMSEKAEMADQLNSLNGMVGRLLFDLERIHAEINRQNERKAKA